MKSADAVAAKDASGDKRAWYTAPLWPKKVPILHESVLSIYKFV